MDDYQFARQRLNLSQAAADVLENDRHEFLERSSFAGIVNLVLRSFMEDSDASIDNALQRRRAELAVILADVPEGAAKQAAIGALLERRREELFSAARRYPRGMTRTFRLDQDNYQFVQEWRDVSDCYGGRPGLFLKAVVEEYAEKPLYEREAILLRDRMDELDACIKAHQLIVVTLKGNTPGKGGPKRYEVRPHSIEHDPGFNYHYLVGYSRRAGTEDLETPASFRLSRIAGIRRSHARSGKVTAEQKREITKKLQTDGVQFLLQESEPIRLKLTGRGKQMYESQGHLRPPFVRREEREDGSWNYEFNCTQTQAEYYFFKFGADAEVESPPGLRERFRKKYADAARRYGPEGGGR